MRILVVEDEPLIAMEIEEILREAGYRDVQIAATVEQALKWVETDGVGAAVLDANLGGASAEPVAAALLRRSIPFVGLSGYSADQRPASFAFAPFVSKPFKPADLIAVCAKWRLSAQPGRRARGLDERPDCV